MPALSVRVSKLSFVLICEVLIFRHLGETRKSTTPIDSVTTTIVMSMSSCFFLGVLIINVV